MSLRKEKMVIVGAGVAGSILAAYLGKNGYPVTIIEQDWREQDRIVGELLQPGGVSLIHAMGLEQLLEGFDSAEVKGYVLHNKNSSTSIAYPEGENCYSGRGFHNGKFVQSIRNYISTLPNVRCIKGKVTRLLYRSENFVRGIEYSNEEGLCKIESDLTVICEGAFSKLRNQISDSNPLVSSHFVGLLIDNDEIDHKWSGQVILSETGPILVYPVSKTKSRVLIDFQGTTPPRRGEELTSYLISVKSNYLPENLKVPFIEGVKNSAIKCMPNNYLPVSNQQIRGALLLGDSQNMRHPLTGGGMSAALNNVHYLGYQILLNPECIKKSNFYSEYTLQAKSANASINILANALYEVMNDPLLRDACFDFLNNEQRAKEPMELLSVQSRNKYKLIKNFVNVAFTGASFQLKNSPDMKGLQNGIKLVHTASKILYPLLKNNFA